MLRFLSSVSVPQGKPPTGSVTAAPYPATGQPERTGPSPEEGGDTPGEAALLPHGGTAAKFLNLFLTSTS